MDVGFSQSMARLYPSETPQFRRMDWIVRGQDIYISGAFEGWAVGKYVP